VGLGRRMRRGSGWKLAGWRGGCWIRFSEARGWDVGEMNLLSKGEFVASLDE
jgi:hypothetical protein